MKNAEKAKNEAAKILSKLLKSPTIKLSNRLLARVALLTKRLSPFCANRQLVSKILKHSFPSIRLHQQITTSMSEMLRTQRRHISVRVFDRIKQSSLKHGQADE